MHRNGCSSIVHRESKQLQTPFAIGTVIGFQQVNAAATRNLISAAIEIAANATMTCGPTNRPRIWFFVDELPSLN